MNKTNTSIDFLTKSQVIKLFFVSNNTLMNVWVENGLPVYKVNGKIYFKLSDIEVFIESHKR